MTNLSRASREGDGSLHLSATHDFIPLCFAYDRQNYAQHLSRYYAEKTKPEHPQIHAYSKRDGFPVQIGTRNLLGRIPVYQAVEESINKDTETP